MVIGADLLDIEIRNNPEDGELNHECGAEHAQKQRLPPRGFDPAADKLKRLASVDGDADRLVYHYFDSEGQWQLLDGDAMSAIAAVFLREQFDALNIAVDGSDGGVDLGIVQTAYANGASSAYIRDTLKMPLQLAKTGVKFVHHKAEGFELGVYFEANGHGTVLFSKKLLDRLYAMRKSEADLSVSCSPLSLRSPPSPPRNLQPADPESDLVGLFGCLKRIITCCVFAMRISLSPLRMRPGRP